MMKYFSGVIGLLITTMVLGQDARKVDREQVIFLTQEWKGERFNDGRPKVSDDLLKRMRNVATEQAWSILCAKGFNNQFAGNWMKLRDDQPFVGRALTAQYMPLRPDLESKLMEKGRIDGLGEIKGFNAYVRGWDPTFLTENFMKNRTW